MGKARLTLATLCNCLNEHNLSYLLCCMHEDNMTTNHVIHVVLLIMQFLKIMLLWGVSFKLMQHNNLLISKLFAGQEFVEICVQIEFNHCFKYNQWNFLLYSTYRCLQKWTKFFRESHLCHWHHRKVYSLLIIVPDTTKVLNHLRFC